MTIDVRRLAAILAADVVGYSRLMSADEGGTLTHLKTILATIVDPVVAQFRGRIVGSAGDSVLVEFSSAVDAVECAVKLQDALTEEGRNLLDSRRMILRIGVNLGDVIASGGTIYGEGVNIAARLEKLSPPGGICVSRSVFEQVKGKLPIAFTDLGEQQVHNIAHPVWVFRAELESSKQPSEVAKPTLPTKPLIAVLPFQNMSGDSDQEYFSDGITEDIITELSRFRMLSVIARTSSFQYRKAVDVRRIRTELGAQYIVVGSVRKMGDRVRITTQLIDAGGGNHLWSERYDRNISELFEVQDELIQTIVSTITGRLEDTEIARAVRRPLGNVEAYDLFLRGVAEFRRWDEGANRRARMYFEQAIAVDPDLAAAHAEYSRALLIENGFDNASPEIKALALEQARLAVRLDARDSRCQSALGWAYRCLGEFELAKSHMEQGLKLNPNDANTLADMANILTILGRPEEGVAAMIKAMELNPYHPDWCWIALSMYLFACRRYEQALAASARSGNAKTPWTLAREAACLAGLGRIEEANRTVSEVLRLQPNFRIMDEMPNYQRAADRAHIRDTMRKAGLPD